MKFLILLILFFPSLVLAVDDATIQAIGSKASSANLKADGNNSRIQALEAEDINLHNRINTIELMPGPQGLQGSQGPAGNDGAQGPSGSTGAQGPKGDTGLTGPTGATGPQGVKGDTGPQGIVGADGATGPQGFTGADGKLCTAIQGEGSATISCEDGSMASVYDGAAGTGTGSLIVDSDNDMNVEGMRPRIIRQIYVQTDDVSRTFNQSWALGATFSTITDFKAGSWIRLNYHVPMRNDSQSWGGGYIEPQVSFDGGISWVSLGSSGYDGGVMSLSSPSIGSYTNTLLIKPEQTADYSVIVRFFHRAYTGDLLVNMYHDIQNISGSAPLLGGDNSSQHYTRVIVEELY